MQIIALNLHNFERKNIFFYIEISKLQIIAIHYFYRSTWLDYILIRAIEVQVFNSKFLKHFWIPYASE